MEGQDFDGEEDFQPSEKVGDVITLEDGKVVKKILQVGQGWEKPGSGAEVSVHYTGTLHDNGEKFDSSVDRGEHFKFKLGQGSVIKGWDVGVATMKKGEKALFTIAPDYAYGASGSPPKIGPNATLDFEVELFDWTDEKDISRALNRTLLKKVTKEGEGWVFPNTHGCKVRVNYTVSVGGEQKESHQDVELVIGDTDFTPRGLRRAIKQMKKGESAIVRIPAGSPYNYPNSTSDTQITIDLTSFDAPKNQWEMTTEDKVAASKALREQGNNEFKAQQFKRANKKYKAAFKYVESDYSAKGAEEKQLLADEKVLVVLNQAATLNALGQWKSAIAKCDEVLKTHSSNVKALLRRGRAHLELDNWRQSEIDFDKVISIEPGNAEVKLLKAKLNERVKAHERKERSVFGGLFSKMAALEAKEAPAAAPPAPAPAPAAPADAPASA